MRNFLKNIEVYKGIMDDLIEGCAVIDFNYNYLYINKMSAGFLKKEPSSIIGKKIYDIIPAYKDSIFFQTFKKAVDKKEPQTVEALFKFDNGNCRWFESKYQPIPEGIVILTKDVTDRKRLQLSLEDKIKERDVLLREVYHRTKNNMQVITSLISIKLSHLKEKETKEIFSDVQNRIKAIALVHQLLCENGNLVDINLKEYITDLITPLIHNSQSTQNNLAIIYELEDVHVSIDTAIPCGLVLTEVVLNSIKHAFPDNKKGAIKIKLSTFNENEIHLEISDDGVGMTEMDGNADDTKIGLYVLKDIVENQLGGSIEMINDNGVLWKIRFRNPDPIFSKEDDC